MNYIAKLNAIMSKFLKICNKIFLLRSVINSCSTFVPGDSDNIRYEPIIDFLFTSASDRLRILTKLKAEPKLSFIASRLVTVISKCSTSGVNATYLTISELLSDIRDRPLNCLFFEKLRAVHKRNLWDIIPVYEAIIWIIPDLCNDSAYIRRECVINRPAN